MPGVRLEAAGAHTEGSMNVHVDTADGLATICGDVIYDFNDQIVTPFHEISDHGAAHHRQSRRLQARREGADQEAAVERAYLLPVHDRPAKIEHGLVTGRMHDAVPGPVVQSLPKRNWFPA